MVLYKKKAKIQNLAFFRLFYFFAEIVSEDKGIKKTNANVFFS